MPKRARGIMGRWRVDPGADPGALAALESLLEEYGASLPFAPHAEGVAVMYLDLRWRVTWASMSYVGKMEGRHIADIAQTPQAVLRALELCRRTLEAHTYQSAGEHGTWDTYVAPRWAHGRLIGYRVEAAKVAPRIPDPLYIEPVFSG